MHSTRRARGRRQPARDRARDWLNHALSSGPVTAEALRWQAHRQGIAWRTVQRAGRGIVQAVKVGFDRSHWLWAKKATPEREGRQQEGFCPTCGAERGVPHS